MRFVELRKSFEYGVGYRSGEVNCIDRQPFYFFYSSSVRPRCRPCSPIKPVSRPRINRSESYVTRIPKDNPVHEHTENIEPVTPTPNNRGGRRYAPIAPHRRINVISVRPRRRHQSPFKFVRAFHPLATFSPWSGLFNCYRPITSSSAVAAVQSVAAVPAAAVVTTVITKPEKVAKMPANAAS